MDYDALENVLRHSVITFGGVVQTDLGNKSADAIAALRSEPIDMVLYCPKCGLQHIDEPSESWDNPPHKSHLCHRCGLIWRPCDRPTNGVCATATVGKADNWNGPTETVAEVATLRARNEALVKANGILEDALQEVGDDYPGSSCQEWCQQRVKAARAALAANREG